MVATSERTGAARGLPPVGTILVRTYKGRAHTVEIVEVKALPAGRGVKYRNNIFPSLSTAAKAITGYTTSGPAFFSPLH